MLLTQEIIIGFLRLTSYMIDKICMQNADTLQVLNLSYSQLNSESVQVIAYKCVALKEINIGYTCLPLDALTYFCNNLTNGIVRLGKATNFRLIIILSLLIKHLCQSCQIFSFKFLNELY